VQVVVIGPHAGYARAVRELLPQAALAVDHFHLVMLANRAVTAVRQRVTGEPPRRPAVGHPPRPAGRRADPGNQEREGDADLTVAGPAGLNRMIPTCPDRARDPVLPSQTAGPAAAGGRIESPLKSGSVGRQLATTFNRLAAAPPNWLNPNAADLD
jgi:hypothetical protein